MTTERSVSSRLHSREEELAALIAEQERDARYGDRVLTERRLSLDYAFDDGLSFSEIIGGPDSSLVALTDEPDSIVRRIPRPQKWTCRQIISAIQKWAKEHGEPPLYKEWKRPNGRGIPSTASVARAFGSWNAAIEAAGFSPRPVGGTSHQEHLQGKRLVRRIRRRKRTAYLTPEKIAAAYVLYDRQGLSMPKLVELLWKSYGYRSRKSCYTALLRAFHAEGFRMRDKREAAALVDWSVRHERARKGGLTASERRAA